MQRANVTVDPSQFRSPVPAGYAAPPRSIRRGHAVTVDEMMHWPEESSRAAGPPIGESVAPPDLLAIFVERTSGAPIERFHVASCLVSFLAILGATLLYHGTASAGGFDLLTAAGMSSFAAAVAITVGARAWLTNCLRETAIDIGIPQAQAHQHARVVMKRLTASSARRP
jgi:hypothetical protein